VESLRSRTSCQWVVGVMRSLVVIVAVMPLGTGTRSVGGVSGSSPFVIPPFVVVPFEDASWFLSVKSSTHFGSSKTSSGIGSSPSGKGYSSRRHFRSFTDHGTNDPSMLGHC
jgi:hypothetical protein